jgi:DNA-binding NtrC family response regulator
MKQKRILLVDDEPSILKSFSLDFSLEGFKVRTASAGEKAIEEMQAGYFDLVITDLVMPGIGGMEVLQEAKKIHPDIGSIILTGYGDLSSAVEALRLGADDYLIKPCDIDELLLRVNRCLEKKEMMRKLKLYEKILPVCMYCKSIRADNGSGPGQGKWVTLEEYLLKESGTLVSHGCCPECGKKVIDSHD